MKKTGLVIIAVGIVLLALFLIFRAPSIPHPIEGMKECLTCHGSKSMKPYPAWHAKRSYRNNDCSSCHHLKSEERSGSDTTTK